MWWGALLDGTPGRRHYRMAAPASEPPRIPAPSPREVRLYDTQLLAAIPDGVILTDPAGVVRHWNDEAARLFGWTAVEMEGRPLAERYPVSARATMQEHLREIARGGEWRGEFLDVHKDGRPLWVDTRMRPVRDEDGTITSLLILARLAHAPQTADEVESRLVGDLLDSMPGHVALLGPDEIASGQVKFKRLRDGQEVTASRAQAAEAVWGLLNT